MNKSKRIYVDSEFAKKLKIKAAIDDKSVIDLTKNLDVMVTDSKRNYSRFNSKDKKKKSGVWHGI
jgi:hypothetical protein